ncbi:MAG: succinyl-diaminopimelate desuccinylase [Aeromonas sp.]
MPLSSPTVHLAQQLLRCPSLTPADAGCQPLLAARLTALGFVLRWLPAGEVMNLWAVKAGQGAAPRPLFCFAGHTDVVPVGAKAAWQAPPFAGEIHADQLIGRGAVDMKGALAAMVVAAEQFLAAHPTHHNDLAFLLTSDEEGDAVHGTRHVMQVLTAERTAITWCLVGEPSSRQTLGDVIKVGRRGSLSARVQVLGRQGHVAYPHLADNPIHRALPAFTELATTGWDSGNAFFPPTSFQWVEVQAGAGASNVIPADLTARFNVRFSSELSASAIQTRVSEIFARHKVPVSLEWQLSGEPFLTAQGALLAAALRAISQCGGQTPTLCTAGGTSDGRFIAPSGAQVIELGLLNATIHQSNEQVSVHDLNQLTLIYQHILELLLL